MSTTSEGQVEGFSTGTITQSNESQKRASFSSIDARGLVSDITLNEGDTYNASFFYRETGASTWNEQVVGTFSNPRIIRDKITGLTANTDYEYYLSINGDTSLESTSQSAFTYQDETIELTNSVLTSELPVTTVDNAEQTRTSMVLQGSVEDTANLQSGDIFRPGFSYREEGTSTFTEVDLGTATDTGLFETEITGLTEDQGYEFLFRASGSEGLILLRATPTDLTDTGQDELFRTLAYQEIITPEDGVEQTKRNLVVEYDLNIDAQGTHEFIYNRNGTEEVLNTVTTPNSNRQTVTIEDIDRDADVKQYTLTFTDESGGSGPGDLSRTQEVTISVIPVKKLTGDNQTFTAN